MTASCFGPEVASRKSVVSVSGDRVAACDMDTHECFIRGSAGSLHVYDSGPGDRPIIFVPALGGTIFQWRAQTDHFAKDHRIVVVEPRGHGKSDKPQDRDYSFEAMASDVEAVANSLSLGPSVLVGHSMGGGVAVAYAAAHPARVAGLLLADPTDDPQARPAIRRWLGRVLIKRFPFEAHWNRILEAAKPDVKASVLDDLRAIPQDVLLDILTATSAFNASAALAKYPGPVLSVLTPFGDVRSALHKVSSRVRAVFVEDTSHWLQMDDPATFNRILNEFLRDIVWQAYNDRQQPPEISKDGLPGRT
jgi:pimeloyl-ACP methyl ester carboxylesterase